ncbi:DgyrCDS1768 [Dimorphilus gyrociliatus]|uniref:Ubiquinone biosynthesis protein COQ4 homolog, mitochondrial n=1 Tax=Dimorphilus gyrociliatus TaxID=2664684 RepID=A0A7I8V9S1_9ANNE|nr:DgyrCDS1768 [Dimorphilus gyrociliatus]
MYYRPIGVLEEPVIESKPAYDGHIQTTKFQKFLLGMGSGILALTNPKRGDMVALMGESTGECSLKYMQSCMSNDPTGRRILADQPRINSATVDLDELAKLPEGTLGHEYIRFLNENGIHPDDRLPVEFVDDPSLAYVMTRYREIHDLVHLLCGMPTNMLGEVVVKVVEGLQTRLPMCVLGGLGGPIRLGPKHRNIYFTTHFPFAVQTGLKAKSFFNVYFEEEWETDLEELRNRLNIPKIPQTPKLKNVHKT